MQTFTDPFFWLFFLYFVFSLFLAFYIPGVLLLQRLSLSFFQKSVLAVIVGMILWGWQGIIFGYLNLRFLSYIYISIAFCFWVYWLIKNHPKWKKPSFGSIDRVLTGLVILGIIIQLTTVLFIGVSTSTGLYFCCGNSSDLLFHGALTNQIIQQFPPFQPGLSGVIVQNYHYWSNIVIAELVRVFYLPLLPTQYQYSSLFLSLFLGLTVIVFGQLIKAKKLFIAWLLFFIYFGGDLGYVILLLLGNSDIFTMGSMEDGSKFLSNPPRAFSIVIFFAALSLLTYWIQKKDKISGVLTGLLIGSSVGFKVYTGIFGFLGLGALTIYYFLKKDFRILLPLLVAIITGAIVYLPVNKDAGGMYFVGLWIFENYIVNPSLHLQGWEHARLVYLAHNNWLRVIQYEVMFISMYIIATFGSKLLGLVQTKKSLQLLPREIHIFLIVSLLVSSIAGLFFQQTSGGSNTFNFLVSVFILGSIYTALASYYWSEKLKGIWKYLFILIVVLLTIPRVVNSTYATVKELATNRGFMISHEELQGYTFLNEKDLSSSSIVIDERNFAMHASSPYPSILLNGHMYLSGRGILESHGINVSGRKKVRDIIFKSPNEKMVKDLLKQHNITYVIMRPHVRLVATRSAAFMDVIYKNKDIQILEFDK